VLTLELTASNAALLEAHGRSVEIAYKRVGDLHYLTIYEPETRLILYAPLVAMRDLALIVGGQSALIRPARIRAGRLRVAVEASRAVSISRIDRPAAMTA